MSRIPQDIAGSATLESYAGEGGIAGEKEAKIGPGRWVEGRRVAPQLVGVVVVRLLSVTDLQPGGRVSLWVEGRRVVAAAQLVGVVVVRLLSEDVWVLQAYLWREGEKVL